MLTCYSGLVFLLATYVERRTVAPRDAKRMVALSPTQRLEWLRRQRRFAACHATVDVLLARYEVFLANTDAPEEVLVDNFKRATYSRRLATEVGQFGDLMWQLLREAGGDSAFLRMLVV